MNKRTIYSCLLDSLSDTPVIFLRGARQTGKTTLVKQLSKAFDKTIHKRQYITFDSLNVLDSALRDPSGFLKGLQKPVIIDEIQRVPSLLLAIKEDVDKNRNFGRYLLTGSANILSLPKLLDSLSGRIEILTLYPFSQSEILGFEQDLISVLFSRDFFKDNIEDQDNLTREQLLNAIILGGYPEVLSRKSYRRCLAWFDSYITTLLERDVRDLANIQDVRGLMYLLRMLGVRSSCLYNQAEFSRSTKIPATTLNRYVSLLESLYLIWFLPAWSINLGKRLVKSPKMHVIDSGLNCYLLGADINRLKNDLVLSGRVFESFIAGELLKQSTWTKHWVSLFHYRSHNGEEIDILLEDRAGYIVGIEVKFSDSISISDIKSLVSFKKMIGDKFVRGIIFYTGDKIIPFSEDIFAIPVATIFKDLK